MAGSNATLILYQLSVTGVNGHISALISSPPYWLINAVRKFEPLVVRLLSGVHPRIWAEGQAFLYQHLFQALDALPACFTVDCAR